MTGRSRLLQNNKTNEKFETDVDTDKLDSDVMIIIMNKFFGGILRLKIDIIQMVFLLNEFAYDFLKNLSLFYSNISIDFIWPQSRQGGLF